MNKFNQLSKAFTCILIVLAIAACQTTGLSRKQIHVLKQQGFELTQDGWTLKLPERLLFAVDQATIETSTATRLADLSKQLEQIEISHLIIQGHTDNTGSDDYNLQLSQKRAKTVAAIMINNGIPAGNIQTVGLADKKPIASNATTEGRAANRRVAIIVVP